jgi:hypothetical protein
MSSDPPATMPRFDSGLARGERLAFPATEQRAEQNARQAAGKSEGR